MLVVLLLPSAVSAQRFGLVLRAGVTASSALVTEQVSIPAVEQIIGAPIEDEVSAVPAPAPGIGAAIRAGFWPRAWLEAGVEYSPGTLEADEESGRRTIQDLNVLQATLGLAWAVRPRIELAAHAGLLGYDTEERGLFAGGAGTSGTLGARVAWIPAVLSDRLALEGGVQVHRFGTPALRRAGGIDGNVMRFTINARVGVLEVGR